MMRKIIQNYSILVFPILTGIITILFLTRNTEFRVGTFLMIILGVVSTLIVLPLLLYLSNRKSLCIRFLFGVASSILVYIVAILLSFIATGVVGGKIANLIYEFWSFIKLTGIMTVLFLIMFLPFDITVILCFLLNDIYAKKIGKIICIKKEVEDAE